MTDPNSKTGYDAATVAASVALSRYRTCTRALPIAPPAPLQADDVALIAALRKAVGYYRANDWPESDTELLTLAADALARRAVPAVDETELDRLRKAATALIADVRARHPGEDLRCPHMIALDAALNREGNAG